MLIGELSAATGVSRRSLRYYEEQGLLTPVRDGSGYRRFTADAPLVVAQIQGLFGAGLDSGTVARYLSCARGPEPDLIMCPDLRRELLDRAAEIDRRRAELLDQRKRLDHHLG